MKSCKSLSRRSWIAWSKKKSRPGFTKARVKSCGKRCDFCSTVSPRSTGCDGRRDSDLSNWRRAMFSTSPARNLCRRCANDTLVEPCVCASRNSPTAIWIRFIPGRSPSGDRNRPTATSTHCGTPLIKFPPRRNAGDHETISILAAGFVSAGDTPSSNASTKAAWRLRACCTTQWIFQDTFRVTSWGRIKAAHFISRRREFLPGKSARTKGVGSPTALRRLSVSTLPRCNGSTP